MSDYPAKEFEIALWRKTFTSGKEQLQGKIEAPGNPLHGRRVKAWLETDKRNPSAPDYRVVFDDWTPGQQREPQSAKLTQQARDRAKGGERAPVEDMDDELPEWAR